MVAALSPTQGRTTMTILNYEITSGQDYATRATPRPWFSIEKQEHAEEWEILMGGLLLLVTKQEVRRNP